MMAIASRPRRGKAIFGFVIEPDQGSGDVPVLIYLDL